VLNPHLSLRECADHFGYTQPWLSQLIHSDIFQARLKERQMEVAARVAQSIPDKLRAVTDIALDKLAEKVADSEDPEFILDAADRALHRMGYAPASARNPAGSPAQLNQVSNQTNVFVLGQDDLHQARELMKVAGQLPSGLGPTAPPHSPLGATSSVVVDVIEGECVVAPAAA
jgi:hypothetical protein